MESIKENLLPLPISLNPCHMARGDVMENYDWYFGNLQSQHAHPN